MLDPFAQLFQHCWGHARSLRMDYKDLWRNNFGSCCARLHVALQMLSKISKKHSETKSLTTFKIRLKVQVCFRLLIRLFTTTTSFQHTATTLSFQNQISTSTPTSLQHLKSLLPPKITIFCYFMLNSTRNKFH